MEKLTKNWRGKGKIYLYFDRACKYVPHLKRQPFFQRFVQRIIALLPKAHAYCHEYRCLRLYHPMRNTGCGDTDGECCERCWAFLGAFGKITKEMLAANRIETLEDALFFFSRQKFRGMKVTLMKKLVKVRLARAALNCRFQVFGISIQEGSSLFESEKLGFFFSNDQVDVTPTTGVPWDAYTIALKPMLSKMRSLARERATYLLLIQAGNLGQFRSQAVNRRLKNLKQKLTRALSEYNTWVTSHPESNFEEYAWSDLADSDSSFWAEGNHAWMEITDKIDAYCRLIRNYEEEAILQEEISLIDTHLRKDIQLLSDRQILGDIMDPLVRRGYEAVLFSKREEMQSFINQVSVNASLKSLSSNPLKRGSEPAVKEEGQANNNDIYATSFPSNGNFNDELPDLNYENFENVDLDLFEELSDEDHPLERLEDSDEETLGPNYEIQDESDEPEESNTSLDTIDEADLPVE